MAHPVVPLLALFAVSIGIYAAFYARGGHVKPTRDAMGFLHHLREFGARLVRVAILFGYWTIVVGTFRFERFFLGPLPLATPVFDLFASASAGVYVALAHASLPDGVQVIVTRPTEAVAAQLQVSFLLAAVLTLPVIIYEAWAFFAPALEPKERRTLARALPMAGVLFLAGAAFAFFFVVPLLFSVLYAFAAPLGAASYLTAGSLVGTLFTFALCFGIAFEMPLIMALLVRLRIVQPSFFLRYWRHATVVIMILAAIVTDPTLVSQLMVGGMLLVLYWGGVAFAYLARPGERVADVASQPVGTA